MILILKADVRGLGKKGEKVTVADGYGRNYLLPRNLAFLADEGALHQLKERETVKADKTNRELQRAQKLASELEGIILMITARHGEGGKLFGSVTTMQIAEELQKQKGITIDRKKIEINEPIKSIGHHQAVLHLYTNVSVVIGISVQA